jgi:hypothetical protein
MGKGSNVQKATQARERNMKKMGKSDEDRKEALAKHRKDATAKQCIMCRQTFMVNAPPPVLHSHIVAKHPELTEQSQFTQCFLELADFDVNDPKGEKAAAAAKVAAAAKPKKAASKGGANFDDLLNVGLTKGKKGKK